LLLNLLSVVPSCRRLSVCHVSILLFNPSTCLMLTRCVSDTANVQTNNTSLAHQILTPLSDHHETHDELEVDFTHIFSTRKPSAYTSGNSPIGTDDHCGFCSDVENCICRQQEELNKSLPPIDASRATSRTNMASDTSMPSYLEAPTKASGPGTCDMCLADPEKARQCKELAETAHFTPTNNTVPLRRHHPVDTSKQQQQQQQQHNQRTSCSDFFQLARAKNVKLGPENYSRIAHVYPYHSHGTVGDGDNDGNEHHSPAMEMDAQDAAYALAALSRQDTRMERQG
jgi:hypothetical protein